jgi:hypothetical protein
MTVAWLCRCRFSVLIVVFIVLVVFVVVALVALDVLRNVLFISRGQSRSCLRDSTRDPDKALPFRLEFPLSLSPLSAFTRSLSSLLTTIIPV